MTETPQRPFSIRIFVPGGDPDGLRLVEKSNWTGVGMVFSDWSVFLVNKDNSLNRAHVQHLEARLGCEGVGGHSAITFQGIKRYGQSNWVG